VSTSDPLIALLNAALEGDNRALGEFVRQTQPIVWRLCTALGSPGDEEDLVQETYLRATKAIGSYRGDAPVRSWLLSIARNVCADHVRQNQRQRRILDRVVRTTVEDHEPSHDGLHDLVRALPTDRREAFLLTQVLGLSYDEAAETIGCPIGTIRSRVARARADLMDALRQAEAR